MFFKKKMEHCCPDPVVQIESRVLKNEEKQGKTGPA
jgi:hypothetical protein